MRRRNDLCRGVVVLITGFATCATDIVAQEPALRSALTQVRQASPDVFTLEVEVDLPAALLLPGQGNTTRVMRFTTGRDVTATVWKTTRLPKPKYYPPHTDGYEPFDYDAHGNLIVSIWSEGATIRDKSIHEEYSESTGSRVAWDNTVVAQLFGTFLHRYSPSYSNTISLSMLRAIRWALGRPPVEDLGELETEDAKPDGTREICAAGQYSPHSGPGVWTLVVDPASGHLVRKGSFGARREEPRVRCSSEGTRWFGDVALAERGEYITLPSQLSVRLISFSPAFDPAVVAEARQIIARAKTRLVQVYDYRDDPSNPNVKTVQAGDLYRDE